MRLPMVIVAYAKAGVHGSLLAIASISMLFRRARVRRAGRCPRADAHRLRLLQRLRLRKKKMKCDEEKEEMNERKRKRKRGRGAAGRARGEESAAVREGREGVGARRKSERKRECRSARHDRAASVGADREDALLVPLRYRREEREERGERRRVSQARSPRVAAGARCLCARTARRAPDMYSDERWRRSPDRARRRRGRGERGSRCLCRGRRRSAEAAERPRA